MDAVANQSSPSSHRGSFPFPVHGLDKAMGLAPTRLAICSFIYGCIGISFATDDELHYDSGLATGYWWKTKF
jgi:hypothetical protein